MIYYSGAYKYFTLLFGGSFYKYYQWKMLGLFCMFYYTIPKKYNSLPQKSHARRTWHLQRGFATCTVILHNGCDARTHNALHQNTYVLRAIRALSPHVARTLRAADVRHTQREDSFWRRLARVPSFCMFWDLHFCSLNNTTLLLLMVAVISLILAQWHEVARLQMHCTALCPLIVL